MFGIGPQEMIIVLIIGVLLFGKRLPEVGKSLGKGIVEFKKGMRGIEDELNSAVNAPSSSRAAHVEADDHIEATAPKFEPPVSEPQVESTQA